MSRDQGKPRKPRKKVSKLQGNLFDIRDGRARRDAGMAQALDGNDDFKIWHAKTILALPLGWIGTSEDIRKIGIGKRPEPRHHNCWGACWNAAVMRGEIERLPEQVHMEAKKAHARRTNLFIRIKKRDPDLHPAQPKQPQHVRHEPSDVRA